MADASREYEVNGETFRHNQRVSLVVKLPSGATRRLSGTLYTVNESEAFIDTEFGIFVGKAATLESEEYQA